MDQAAVSQRNQQAWNDKSYQAWQKKFGTPEQAAAQLLANPSQRSRRITPYIDNLHGKKIANPLGSNGRLGVSLALQGADVTVLDISEANERYAQQVAQHAGVSINFIICDFAQGISPELDGIFDVVVLELGVLHYFLDIDSVMDIVNSMLKRGGQLIINEFHPVMKKLINVSNGEPGICGNYFDGDVQTADVAYKEILTDEALPNCLVRRWTLGEIVTAVAQSGFIINRLDEQPGWQLENFPELFTLLATKMQ